MTATIVSAFGLLWLMATLYALIVGAEKELKKTRKDDKE